MGGEGNTLVDHRLPQPPIIRFFACTFSALILCLIAFCLAFVEGLQIVSIEVRTDKPNDPNDGVEGWWKNEDAGAIYAKEHESGNSQTPNVLTAFFNSSRAVPPLRPPVSSVPRLQKRAEISCG